MKEKRKKKRRNTKEKRENVCPKRKDKNWKINT
jgi:hypothetical protein